MAGLIYIIGMGPGAKEMMTEEAYLAIKKASVIVGYTVYVDLVKKHFSEKKFFTTPMRQEIERCRACFDFAIEGKNVAFRAAAPCIRFAFYACRLLRATAACRRTAAAVAIVCGRATVTAVVCGRIAVTRRTCTGFVLACSLAFFAVDE